MCIGMVTCWGMEGDHVLNRVLEIEDQAKMDATKDFEEAES